MEEVKLIDDFTNKKTGRTSNCYRISYRSNERSLTDDEINDLQARQQPALAKAACNICYTHRIIRAPVLQGSVTTCCAC